MNGKIEAISKMDYEHKFEYYFSHIKNPVVLMINFLPKEVMFLKKYTKKIYYIGKERLIDDHVTTFPSLKEFQSNFTSLDPKITHVFINYYGWRNIKNQLPPRSFFNPFFTYLFVKIELNKWKDFLEKDKYLIENELKEHDLSFENFVFLNEDNYMYAVFVKKEDKNEK